MRRNTLTSRLGLLVSLMGATGAAADCIDSAAAYHGVNPYVLRAIGWHESRLRPDAVSRNSNGTIDIGAFQINSIHLRELSQYGIGEKGLKDGCVAAYVGAWHYRKQIREYGNTWAAVGAYHSRTPARQAWYANQIAAILMKWGVMPKGPLPYTGVPLLAPNQRSPGGGAAEARGPSPKQLAAVSGSTVFDVTDVGTGVR